MKIAAVHRKGGTGKTSCLFHLAGALGGRILLVDVDPQASLTKGFLGPEEVPGGIVKVFEGGMGVIHDVSPQVSLVPGSRGLNRYNLPLPQPGHVQTLLREFLEDIGAGFDHVLIDTPPNISLCTWNALIAADRIIVPLQPEDFGVGEVAEVLAAVAGANPNLGVGFLLNMVQRWSLHEAFEGMLRETYGEMVLRTTLPRLKDFPEAVAARKPVGWYRPKSAAALAVRELAHEQGCEVAEQHGPKRRGSVDPDRDGRELCAAGPGSRDH